MSESLSCFRTAPTARATAVALPFVLRDVLQDWSSLRVPMTRHRPDAFQRDEWAYLIQFLETEHLLGVFKQSFGEPEVTAASTGLTSSIGRLVRPRGTVAVWLPNNVSLLGPLVTILLSLTGNRVLLKGGSTSADLTGAFLEFAREHLGTGPLAEHIDERLCFEVFDRAHARNREFCARADVRILFGSDAAAAAIDANPHPLGSSSFAFIDRRSEAWIAPESVDDTLVDTLLKVFGIYGQAGCTSPRRAVLLGGTSAGARQLRDRLVERWPQLMRRTPAPHVASNNVMAQQLARAGGWDAELVPEHGALFCTGSPDLTAFNAPMALTVVPLDLERTVQELPHNIQTIGHAVPDAEGARWLRALASTSVKRLVPLARMHHFGPVWDGFDYWRQTFEEVEIER